MKIEALLFDLDNTLILFDEKEFFKTYTYKLYKSFQDIFTPEEFGKKLMHSSIVMTNNDGKMTNAEYFIQDFASGTGVAEEDLWRRFEEFYASDFEQFSYLMTPLPEVKNIFDNLKEEGYKIVIASNPMFPENVQQYRLRWAGLDNIQFDLITHANNSTFCKPNPAYYTEICEKIDVGPENCMMVGNDDFNDMIASKTGMKTFLTFDGEKNKTDVSRELTVNNKFELPEPDHKGKIDQLLGILESYK
ncbi:HAD family hydrolase [Bacteroidota bacterium]